MKNRLLPNLKRSLGRNIGWKILALVLSATLWFIINNITDPIGKADFNNMKVEIINTEEITSIGKTYDVINGTGIVPTVTVTGRRSVLDKLTKDDIKVVADMRNLTVLDTLSIQAYSIRNTTDNDNLDFKCSIETVQLSIESLKSIQMIINTSTIGEPANGYVKGTVTPSQNIVRISGPESIINEIHHVNAVADITSFKNDVNTNVELRLYNIDNVEIKSNALQMNISTINVAVTILATKEVPISFTTAGEPADGYMLSGDNISIPANIMIAGRKKDLDAINEVVIGGDEIDLTDANESITEVVNVKKFLPTGVIFADPAELGNVSITVGIEKKMTKQLEIPKRNFAINHIPNGYECTIKELSDDSVDSYSIDVVGIAKNLAKVRATDIIGVVDMDMIAEQYEITEWTDGEYTINIVFNIPDTVELSKEYTMTVKVEEKGEEE